MQIGYAPDEGNVTKCRSAVLLATCEVMDQITSACPYGSCGLGSAGFMQREEGRREGIEREGGADDTREGRTAENPRGV